MPELPEVETVRRALCLAVVGRRVVELEVREPRLRWPVDVRRLRGHVVGARIAGIRRRAKYLLFDLDNGRVMLMHLGMSGTVALLPGAQPLAKHDHLCWQLDDGTTLRFNDPRRFGAVDSFPAAQEASHPRLTGLGVEPFDPALDLEQLARRFRGRTLSVKQALLDGRQLAGVGNIYACEALFRAGIHPGRRADRISVMRWRHLLEAVRETLADAIEQGGTTLRDFRSIDGQSGYFAVRLAVYDREGEPCQRCGRPVRRIVQGARSTFYCGQCQR